MKNRYLKESMLLLRVLLTPMCWIRNGWTDKEWDRSLRAKLLDDPEIIVNDGGCTASIDGVTIWIANHPYASGQLIKHRSVCYGPYCGRRAALLLGDLLRSKGFRHSD